jgi:DNA-binding NarL/FixJ family response regulator
MSDEQTILIVDDHPFFREGLKSLLARSSKYRIVGEAESGDEAFRKAKELNPDLIIMDISLPDGSGIDVTQEIRELLSDTKIVILSMHLKIEYIVKAFRSGAIGYISKDSATEKLLECLRTVSKGEYYVDSSLSHAVVEGLVKTREQETEVSATGYSALTPREQEILRLLAEGLSAKEIADKLFISRKTVENHRSNIMNKLDLHSTVELVRYAAKYGLIDVDLWKK